MNKYGSVQIIAIYFDLLFTEHPNLFKIGLVIINIFSAPLVLQTAKQEEAQGNMLLFSLP